MATGLVTLWHRAHTERQATMTVAYLLTAIAIGLDWLLTGTPMGISLYGGVVTFVAFTLYTWAMYSTYKTA